MKYILLLLFVGSCFGSNFTLDVNIPLRVEREGIAFEVVPQGFFYVGYFNGVLLRFTEDQYREAIALGASFRTDAITPPNAWKGEAVINGYTVDHQPGDRIVIEDNGENYFLRVIRSPSIALMQPVGQQYELGRPLNIVFEPDHGFDFQNELQVKINGSVFTTLTAPPYTLLWTPTNIGFHVIYGSFVRADGTLADTNAVTLEVIGNPIVLNPVLAVTNSDILVGESSTLSISLDNLENFAKVTFFIGNDPYPAVDSELELIHTFQTAGIYGISALAYATDGSTFPSNVMSISVTEPPPPPEYVLPEIAFGAEYMTSEFLAQVVADNANRGEGIDKLFDGSSGSKWLQFLLGKYTTTFDFTWGIKTQISALKITTANDASARDPITFNVIDGETGESFILTGIPINGPRKTLYTLPFPTPVNTTKLRIEMTTNNYGHSMQISELGFVY